MLLILALLLVLGSPSSPAEAAASDGFVQVSHDPFTTPGFEHASEVEPAVAVEGHTIVAAFQVGRGLEGGALDIGVATSSDDGASWSDHMLQATNHAGGSYDRVSDPSLTYDASAVDWLVGFLGITLTGRFDLPSRSAVQVVASTGPAGTSFGAPVTVARAPAGIVYDKPWVTCDEHPASPYFGRCYALWDEIGLRTPPYDAVLASSSSDGGAHWTPPERANGARGTGLIPFVRPDGSVVVVYLSTEHPSRPRVATFSSRDGGQSWRRTTTIAAERRADLFRPVRDLGFPSAAIDAAGSIFVAWSDCRFEPRCSVDDIVVSASPDGHTWSAPQVAAQGSRADATALATPGLAVSRQGTVDEMALVYYAVSGLRCTKFSAPNSCTISVGYASSSDGTIWSAPTMLGWPMRPSWFPSTQAGYMWGDYVGNVISAAGMDVTLLPLANPPTDRLDVGMYAPVGGLQIEGT